MEQNSEKKIIRPIYDPKIVINERYKVFEIAEPPEWSLYIIKIASDCHLVVSAGPTEDGVKRDRWAYNYEELIQAVSLVVFDMLGENPKHDGLSIPGHVLASFNKFLDDIWEDRLPNGAELYLDWVGEKEGCICDL